MSTRNSRRTSSQAELERAKCTTAGCIDVAAAALSEGAVESWSIGQSVS